MRSGVFLSFLVLACSCSGASPTDPGQLGPYPVGVTTLHLTYTFEEKPRTLPVEVWYPATKAAEDLPTAEYTYETLAPDDLKAMIRQYPAPPLTQAAHRDAPMTVGDAPYPLVVFSHGFGGIRAQSVFLTNHLASHGYVVVAPDHVGNTAFDFLRPDGFSTTLKTLLERPADVEFLIDVFTAEPVEATVSFARVVDPTRIGVTGHSMGGVTALVAGARDGRVGAILPMAPSIAGLLGYGESPGHIKIPVMMMAGLADLTISYENDIAAGYPYFRAPKYLVAIQDAGHFSFSNLCELDLTVLPINDLGIGDVEDVLTDGCGPQNIPYDRAYAIINRYAASFFDLYLKERTDRASHLTPEAAATMPEVQLLSDP